MRYLKKIYCVFCFLYVGLVAAQCPPTRPLNLIFSPAKSVYCPGDNITITFTTSNKINVLNWNYNGGGESYTTAVNVFVIRLQTSGQLIIGGTISGPPGPAIGTCNFNMTPITIQVSPQLYVNAGPDVIISGSPNYAPIGGAPSASGGVSPYSYAWTPATNFVNSTLPSQANPQVNPSISTNYQLSVTDANSCNVTDNVMVYNVTSITNNKFYAVFKKELDAGYYNTINNGTTNYLYFKFDEEYYPNGANLTYKLYNDAGTLVSAPTLGPEVIGDNRFSLNLMGIAAGFYKMYVYNQKNEVWQSRIKIN